MIIVIPNLLLFLGSAATVAALVVGLSTLKSGDKQLSQYMMRARVLAQGLTVAALVAGIVIGTTKIN